MATGYLQGVRCFFSIDLVGSTGLKTNPNLLPSRASFDDPRRIDWVEVHLKFFERCIDALIHEPGSGSDPSPWDSTNAMHFWRIRGDEVLFYSGRVREFTQVFDLLRQFCLAVRKIDEYMRDAPVPLGAKGTMWAAGFPIRNREVLMSRHAPYIRPLTIRPNDVEDIDKHVASAPFYDFGQNRWLEFIGPEIDLGFMLSSHVNPGRVVTSIDVANIVANVAVRDEEPLHLHHVGWEVLKGLYSGVPYPVIWADARSEANPVKRVSYEEALSPLSARFFEPESNLMPGAMQRLHAAYLKDTAKYGRIHMYLTDPQAPADDHRQWEKWKHPNA